MAEKLSHGDFMYFLIFKWKSLMCKVKYLYLLRVCRYLVTDQLPSVTGVKVWSKNVALDTEKLDPVFIGARSYGYLTLRKQRSF